MRRLDRLAPAPGAVVLHPTHAATDLPPFTPGAHPDNGWTLAEAEALASGYAEVHHLGRSGAWAAFRALAEHDDRARIPRLRRADMLARLRGERRP